MRIGVCSHHSCGRDAIDGEMWCRKHHPDKEESNIKIGTTFQ